MIFKSKNDRSNGYQGSKKWAIITHYTWSWATLQNLTKTFSKAPLPVGVSSWVLIGGFLFLSIVTSSTCTQSNLHVIMLSQSHQDCLTLPKQSYYEKPHRESLFLLSEVTVLLFSCWSWQRGYDSFLVCWSSRLGCEFSCCWKWVGSSALASKKLAPCHQDIRLPV